MRPGVFTVFITGGTGLIGRAAIARLLRQHPDVRIAALVRSGERWRSLVTTLGPLVARVVPVRGDITCDGLALGRGAHHWLERHSRAVVHLAADTVFSRSRDAARAVNVDGTRHLLEAVRSLGSGYRPRLVFSSSIAVFGPPFPEAIGDDHLAAPLTSYGTQKAIAELLVSDYTRRGFLDGISIRLPTICVRPGEPNKAASGFFSSIIREPLSGHEAVLPVPEDVRHWFASPRAAVGFLVHAATLDQDALGGRRALTMPGVSATVGEMIESLRRIAGAEAVELIRRVPDEATMRMVASWPGRFHTRRAQELGFEAETDFDEIIRAHVEDELNGVVGAVAA